MKQKEVDERIELTDADVVAIIDKMIKQRRDSIAQFEKGGRQDLADNEKFEIGVLQAYMPQALSDAEIDAEIAAAMQATGAKAMADMGKVMARAEAQAGRSRRHGQGVRAGQSQARRLGAGHFDARWTARRESAITEIVERNRRIGVSLDRSVASTPRSATH